MDWSGIANAPVFERGTPFGPGAQFKCKLVRCLTKDSQQSGLLFIVEAEILESGHPLNAVGSKATWIQSFKNKTVAFSAIKAFVCAVIGLDTQRDKQKIETELAPHLPIMMPRIEAGELNGRTFAVTTAPIWTKDNRAFLRHDFSVWEPPAGWGPQPTPVAPPYVDPNWTAASQRGRGGQTVVAPPGPPGFPPQAIPGQFAQAQYQPPAPAYAPPGALPSPNTQWQAPPQAPAGYAPPGPVATPPAAPFDPLASLRR